MIVEFKKITFENILSFGSNPTTFEFNKGLNLILGRNSAGKSTMIDALSFCLFGKPYRKIKIEELINRKNKKNLKVTCWFTIDSKDNFVITRCLNKDKIEITRNGEEIDLLSSKKLNQDEIDKIIGINYQMFKQIISLAINYNKPFLSLSAMEKRDIVENIFNIKVFGQMLKSIKDKSKDLKLQTEMNKNTVAILESNLKSLRKHVKELSEASKNFEKNKINDINKNKIRLNILTQNKNKIFKKIKSIQSKIDKIQLSNDIEELSKKRDTYSSNINKSEYIIKESNKSLKLLDENNTCPLCKSEITLEHKNAEIERLNKIIKDETSKLNKNINDKNKIEKKIKSEKKNKDNKNDLNTELIRVNDKLKMTEEEIVHIEERIEHIKKRTIDFNLNAVTNEFVDKKEEYISVFQHGQSLQNTTKNNDIVINILSESGIKAYFFKKLIPILNAKVNEYLKMFDMPVMLEFDEFMNEKITNIDNLRNSISYNAYSEGEKKRIDMSILLSFINITKVICNWNCNLLIIDELLDGAMDEKGLDKLVSSLKSMTNETNELCVYIISHRLQQDYYELFNSCIKVYKNTNNFSSISYE